MTVRRAEGPPAGYGNRRSCRRPAAGVAPGGALYAAAALLLLLCTLGASIGLSLLLAIVVRDFRTASNLNRLFVLPAMLLVGLCVTLVPGLWRFVVLSALMLMMGGTAAWAAIRWVTFERYLV